MNPRQLLQAIAVPPTPGNIEVASRYEPQLRLCVEGGKLIEADKWGNVARHCFVQASATEEMATLLRLGVHELTRLARTEGIPRLEETPRKMPERLHR